MRQHSDNCGKTHEGVFSAKYLHCRSLAAAVALCAAVAALTARAADWTDADGNEYTALKYIKGNGTGNTGGPYIITDFIPVTPQIAVAEGKTLTAKGTVKVKIAEGSLRVTGGEKILTTCGGFTAEKVSLVAGAPKWVRGLSVNADGNLVLDVKPMGTVITFR